MGLEITLIYSASQGVDIFGDVVGLWLGFGLMSFLKIFGCQGFDGLVGIDAIGS